MSTPFTLRITLQAATWSLFFIFMWYSQLSCLVLSPKIDYKYQLGWGKGNQ